MDKIIEGMKFFDDSLSKKGKMTRNDFAASRRALRRKYQDEMDKLATEYAVRNSIYHVGDKVKVNDLCWLNEPCTILEVKWLIQYYDGKRSSSYIVRYQNGVR